MSDRDYIHTLVCNYKEDFKGETVAAELADNGADPEQILILMNGGRTRPYSADVTEVDTELTENQRDLTVVKTSREGIYDMLPQGLFHEPALKKLARSEQEIILAMKARRNEELEARKFFIPFEATINALRLELAIHENHLDKRSHFDDLASIFAAEWEIFKYLDARQANIFLHIIPIIHDIRDDHAMIKEVMEMMFETEVKISKRPVAVRHSLSKNSSTLGVAILGSNMTTGKIEFDEEVDQIKIVLGAMSGVKYESFASSAPSGKILSFLCETLFPLEFELDIKLLLHSDDRNSRISDALLGASLQNLYI